MTKQFVLVCTLILLEVFAFIGWKRVEGKAMEQTPFDRQTRAVVDATTVFLKALSNGERQELQFAFTPEKSSSPAAFHRTHRTPDGGLAPGAVSNDRLDGPGNHGGPPPLGQLPGPPANDSPGGRVGGFGHGRRFPAASAAR